MKLSSDKIPFPIASAVFPSMVTLIKLNLELSLIKKTTWQIKPRQLYCIPISIQICIRLIEIMNDNRQLTDICKCCFFEILKAQINNTEVFYSF